MHIIVCLDDRGGMMFNHRRQSRDRAVMEDILHTVNGRLLMGEYSRSLLEETKAVVTKDPLAEAREGDWCFLEDRICGAYASKIESMVIYRWNRHYPADLWWDVDPAKMGMTLSETLEFAGTSHEKITKEIWKK